MADGGSITVDVGWGYRLLAFRTIGSTNTEAMDRLKAGDQGRLWVFSQEQTAGRGRRGRVWKSVPGNLAVSLALRLDVPPIRAANLGFVAGVALGEALARCAPEVKIATALDGADLLTDVGERHGRLALKWPNDVTLSGAKLAGISVDSEPLDDGKLAVVIGIGVNVVAAPDGLPYAASSLREIGSSVSAEDVLDHLMAVWPNLFDAWHSGKGFADIRSKWLKLAQGLGETASVSIGSRVMRGTFETIDEDGRLILVDEAGERHMISAGDVHFGVAATVRPEG